MFVVALFCFLFWKREEVSYKRAQTDEIMILFVQRNKLNATKRDRVLLLTTNFFSPYQQTILHTKVPPSFLWFSFSISYESPLRNSDGRVRRSSHCEHLLVHLLRAQFILLTPCLCFRVYYSFAISSTSKTLDKWGLFGSGSSIFGRRPIAMVQDPNQRQASTYSLSRQLLFCVKLAVSHFVAVPSKPTRCPPQNMDETTARQPVNDLKRASCSPAAELV